MERFLASCRSTAVKLVAHDWGAAIGLAFAAAPPERVERLVLINAPPLVGGFHWPRLARLWRVSAIGELVMGSTTQGLLARALRTGRPRGRVDRRADRGSLGPVRPGHPAGDPAPRPVAGEDSLAVADAGRLERWMHRHWSLGRARPVATRRRSPTRTRRHLPGARIERLADAGHWPWLDRERSWSSGIAEQFLDRSSAPPATCSLGPVAKRLLPTLTSAVFAAVYVIVSPPSLDLAAHLLRAKLFRREGFGIWNNWWYAGP